MFRKIQETKNSSESAAIKQEEGKSSELKVIALSNLENVCGGKITTVPGEDYRKKSKLEMN